ncbi:hypothetical protein BDF21DRAFT_424846 [Thamnidium elegans]|nr:hypothetical protein BDF21DRAFT_424846 [Thamnidium elegans]
MSILNITTIIATVVILLVNYSFHSHLDITDNIGNDVDNNIFYDCFKEDAGDEDCLFYDINHSIFCGCIKETNNKIPLNFFEEKSPVMSPIDESSTDKSFTVEERQMKRKQADTESYCPTKHARSLPFFSCQPFTVKRKAFDYQEEPTGIKLKRSRKVPAEIQLTHAFFGLRIITKSVLGKRKLA